MLDNEEKPYLNTTAAIEYHGKSKSAIKPMILIQNILNRAAISGDTGTIKFIKENGAKEMKELRIIEALKFSIENRQEDASVLFVQWGGADVAKYVDQETRETFLHRAAFNGMSKTCSALLSEGSSLNIDSKNRNKSTALHCAVASGDLYTVRVLLDAGASIKIKNDHKNTALSLARLHNQQEIIDCLEKNNAVHPSKTEKSSSNTRDPLGPTSSNRISRIE